MTDISDLWEAIMDWAERTKSAPLNQHQGILSVTLADGYEMHLNGHKESLKATVDGVETEILPFHVMIVKTGYLMQGVYCSPHDGCVFGVPSWEPIVNALKQT